MTSALLDIAARHWDLFVGYIGPAIDPWDLPPHRMLSFVYAWATQGANEDELRRFDEAIWMPPKGEEVTEGPWSPEAEMSAFRGLAAELDIKTTGDPEPS